MRTALLIPLLSLAALAGCTSSGPEEVVQLVPPGALRTEVLVPIRGSATVTNLDSELDLVLGDISFQPDENPNLLRWFSGGPFVLEPGASMSFDVQFIPEAVGPLAATVTVVTDAGTVTEPLELEGLPPVDADGDGFSVALGDCNDADPDIFPGAEELCDGIDNDCDDDIDGPFDSDNDGFLDINRCDEAFGPLDCNDSDGTTFPGNAEECDGSDSDCNGIVDDINVLADLQQGVCEGALKRCAAGGAQEPDYSAIEGYERLEYTCDAVDNDCDGVVDDFDRLGDGTSDCVDDDLDGEREVDGDCDDTDKDTTSADCGPATLVVTRNDDGFATIDLNSGKVEMFEVGVRTYHGVAAGPRAVWLAARDEGRIVRYDLDTGTALLSTRFSRSPWAVEMDDASGDLLVLFGDGTLQRRDPATGGFKSEVLLSGSPTAWTKAPDGTFWICTGGDGQLIHADITGVLGIAEITTACYGPPALRGTRVVVPGFDDRVLIELDTRTLREVTARATANQPVRAAWVASDLWVTTSVTRQVEIYDGSNLLRIENYEFDGQTQGIWYDPTREVVWVAVFGNDEVIGIDRRSRTVKTRLPVPEPVYLFPLPPE